MAKYIKLGEKATCFFDPTLGIKLVGKNVLELPKNWRMGKLLVKALRSDHVVYTEKDGGAEDEEIDFDSVKYEEKELLKFKKPELVEIAKHNVTEFSDEELEAATKAELVEEILELVEA